MTLAEFIQHDRAQIIKEWESFARSLLPASGHASPLALRDHIKDILDFIIYDMCCSQDSTEQVEKSHGEGKQKNEQRPSAAETHAALRLAGGFNLDQMVAEYRALRASVVKLWDAARNKSEQGAVKELTRFNEAIDQSLAESISHYTKKRTDSKNLFLGILTHDLRNPLNAILGAAYLIPIIGLPLSDKQNVLVSQISESSQRINEIVNHLLDITKARFGSGLPVVRDCMDMGFVAKQLTDEMRTIHPDRKFELKISGETEGNWDKSRIAQVFSNLIGNAVQYSFKDFPVVITIKGEQDEVSVSVHNEGVPVPVDKIATIFDSLTRATGEDIEHNLHATTNLGLGLFITNQIVTAHGGKISVTSTEKGGTTFIACFPRCEEDCLVNKTSPNVPDIIHSNNSSVVP
jgi:signal transduction histidine kinase